jgi:hypothetical protein
VITTRNRRESSDDGITSAFYYVLNHIPVVSFILLVYGFLFMFFTTSLFVFHIYLIAKGVTTNEELKHTYRHGSPFSSGFVRNFLNLVCEVPPRSRLMRAGKLNARTPMNMTPEEARAYAAGGPPPPRRNLDGEDGFEEENSANDHFSRPAPLDPEKFHAHPLASSHRFSGHSRIEEDRSSEGNRISSNKHPERNWQVEMVDVGEMKKRQRRYEEAYARVHPEEAKQAAAAHKDHSHPPTSPASHVGPVGQVGAFGAFGVASTVGGAVDVPAAGLVGSTATGMGIGAGASGLAAHTSSQPSTPLLTVTSSLPLSSSHAPHPQDFHSPAVLPGGGHRYSLAVLGAPGARPYAAGAEIPEGSERSDHRRSGAGDSDGEGAEEERSRSQRSRTPEERSSTPTPEPARGDQLTPHDAAAAVEVPSEPVEAVAPEESTIAVSAAEPADAITPDGDVARPVIFHLEESPAAPANAP